MHEIGFAENYLNKHAFTQSRISVRPSDTLMVCVVIPAKKEPGLLRTLESLARNHSTGITTEVIVVFNSSEEDSVETVDINREGITEAEEWCRSKSDLNIDFHFLNFENLPSKHAGAGLARKIGMDEAVRRFSEIGNPNGIILCLDADTIVEENYLAEALKYFRKNEKSPGAVFYFEHPLSGDEDIHEVYDAIVLYELYLRYYKLALKYTGFPNVYHSIGSCIAVNAVSYCKSGGMNKRQAGEDFYFLQKLSILGAIGEINSTCVYPSSRISDRVPFGTGPEIEKIINAKDTAYPTYSFESFLQLKELFSTCRDFYKAGSEEVATIFSKIPMEMRAYLYSTDAINAIGEINANAATEKSFVKRWFQWFNAFRIVKFLNYYHENNPLVPVTESTKLLLKEFSISIPENADQKILLNILRKVERKNFFE